MPVRCVSLLVVIAVVLCACGTTVPGVPLRPSAPSAPAPSPAAPEPDFTVVAAGDVLIHPALTDQASRDGNGRRDYTALFAGVRPVIEGADLAICHLEVPLAGPGGPFRGYPLFSAPPEVAAGLAATGYDTCSTASNHTLDQGPAGVTSTLDILDAAGIRHTGSARSAAEAAAPVVLQARGVRVAQLSYTFGFNAGTTLPADSPWLGNRLDPATVLAAARAARTAGAEVVIVSLHWGIEDRHEPTADQRRIARTLLADPAVDLIVGHHAHVVQPFENINGKWVAYGLGNQVARHAEPRGTTEEGAIARFEFTKTASGWHVRKAEYIPTLIDLGPPIRLRDLTTDPTVDPTRKTQALTRTDQIITSAGAASAGLTRP
ncbi:MAG TPA: CapA family protein [Actinophytocola sp.]|uniref:CapA family protein n=1 Tax=Actinophytocola sp. TaxID=1872138 RepID=UPI002DB7B31D|nr:CapA family protein [Actinophytocola sp.]HEU5471689.1 CapA family protein [Actinophytocola sp.]